MTVKDLPVNKNPLSPLGFKFVISRLPSTVFFCQSVSMPGIQLNNFTTPNPFLKLNLAGTELDFGSLSLKFQVDEDMKNYMELYNWMTGLGFPDNFSQYANLAKDLDGNKGLFSDASLLITTSSKNPNIEITFIDIFPIELTNLLFDSTKHDVQYITADITFSIRKFNINSI